MRASRRVEAVRRRTWRRLLAFAATTGLVFAAVVGAFALRPGPPAAGFEIAVYSGRARLGGDRVAFTDIVGHGLPIVVNFWGSSCPPCRLEMPGFQRVFDRHDGEGYVMLGVDVGPYVGLGTRDGARRFLSEQNITYPTGTSTTDAPLATYGVRGLPTTVFFDGSGAVVDRVVGYLPEARFEQRLAALLGAAASPPPSGARAEGDAPPR
jgi:thiol-disulfide isomerase/thioredoxin